MFEHRKQRLLTRSEFAVRIAKQLFMASGGIAVALGIGVVGYHLLGPMPWIDAYLNAAMILGGMGPIDPLKNDVAKAFAGCYALFAGLVFIAIMGVVLAPFLHRLMHRFHIDAEEKE
jgi:hypothetical protein